MSRSVEGLSDGRFAFVISWHQTYRGYCQEERLSIREVLICTKAIIKDNRDTKRFLESVTVPRQLFMFSWQLCEYENELPWASWVDTGTNKFESAT